MQGMEIRRGKTDHGEVCMKRCGEAEGQDDPHGNEEEGKWRE